MGSILWPEGKEREVEKLMPVQTIEDLQIERLCAFMSYNNYFKLPVNDAIRLWTDDTEVIAYRQAALMDLLENPQLEAALEQLLDCIDVWESRQVTSKRNNHDTGEGINLADFSFLDSYIDRIGRLSDVFEGLDFKSEAMKKLARTIKQMKNSERFAAIKEGFSELCGAYAMPSMISIGFNLDKELKPAGVKLLKIENRSSKRSKMTMTKNSHAQTGQLISRAALDASQAITMYVKRESMELRAVKGDIVFCLSALKLCREFKKRGLDYCFPEIMPMEKKAFTAERMYNPLLVVNQKQEVVSNDIEFKEGGELLILTGANQGGKTVFLLSVALTQWLFQLGMPVPAARAALSPVTEIVTVFAPGGSSYSRHGLLAEEASRIAAAVDSVTENSLVLLNEPLNSTNPLENLYISQEVISVFKAAGTRGVWVTHMYELASGRGQMNEDIKVGSTLGSIRIIVEREEGGVRPTYKIERGEPEFRSYAAEVLRRKGVKMESAG